MLKSKSFSLNISTDKNHKERDLLYEPKRIRWNRYIIALLLIGFSLLLILINVNFSGESYEVIVVPSIETKYPAAEVVTTTTSGSTQTITTTDGSTAQDEYSVEHLGENGEEKVKEESSSVIGMQSYETVTADVTTKSFTCDDRFTCQTIICTGQPVNSIAIEKEIEYFNKMCGNQYFDVIIEDCVFNKNTIDTYMFSGSYRLHSLTIRNCQLQTIAVNAFKQTTMNKLVNLTLNGVQLRSLSDKTFVGLQTVQNFVLINQQQTSSIPLTASNFLQPMAASLSTVILEQTQEQCNCQTTYNPTEWLGDGSDILYSKLLLVDLSGTNFNDTLNTRTFSKLVAVQQLRLANCNLSVIGKNVFSGITNTLQYLDLRCNHLQRLDGEYLALATLHNVIIDMSSNLWHCDCGNVGLVEYLRRVDIQYATDVVCATPIEFQGVNIHYLQLDCKGLTTTANNNPLTTNPTTTTTQKMTTTELQITTKNTTRTPIIIIKTTETPTIIEAPHNHTTPQTTKTTPTTAASTPTTLKTSGKIDLQTTPKATATATATSTITSAKTTTTRTEFSAATTTDSPTTETTTISTTISAIPKTITTKIQGTEKPMTTAEPAVKTTELTTKVTTLTAMTPTTTKRTNTTTEPTAIVRTEPTTISTTEKITIILTTVSKEPTTIPTIAQPISQNSTLPSSPLTTTVSPLDTTSNSKATTNVMTTTPWVTVTSTQTIWPNATTPNRGTTSQTSRDTTIVPTIANITRETSLSTSTTVKPTVTGETTTEEVETMVPNTTKTTIEEATTSTVAIKPTTSTSRYPHTTVPTVKPHLPCYQNKFAKFLVCSLTIAVSICDYDVKFNVTTISSKSVQLQIEGDGSNFKVIYFPGFNYNKYKELAFTTSSRIDIDYLTSNQSYIFCLLPIAWLTTSPFNCRSAYLPTPKSWLDNSDIVLFFTITILITVICIIAGVSAVYFLLRWRPTLIYGSKRLRRLDSTSHEVLLFPKPERTSLDSQTYAMNELSKLPSSISDRLTPENCLNIKSYDYMQCFRNHELSKKQTNAPSVSYIRPPVNRAPVLPPEARFRTCDGEQTSKNCSGYIPVRPLSQQSTVIVEDEPRPLKSCLRSGPRQPSCGKVVEFENEYESLDYYQELY